MEFTYIHSTRLIGLKKFLIFTSTIYFVFYFPEIFVSTDMHSQNSINKYKDTALSPMYLMTAFHLAMLFFTDQNFPSDYFICWISSVSCQYAVGHRCPYLLLVLTLSETLQLTSVKRRSKSDTIFRELFFFN